MNDEHIYIAIDLKSFYASVECDERGLDPLTTNLVVADASRTEKTICLAVSPALKKFGIPGRARLFEVVQKVKEINAGRLRNAPNHQFTGESCDEKELIEHPEWKLSYIAAPPRMAKYLERSTEIYHVYLKYVAPEDIHVYSIDEVFMDVTHYLKNYQLTPRELAKKMIMDVFEETRITATAGIGTNMYLCKIAMDIEAKHIEPDDNGVRIAELDEMSYRRSLWTHRPLIDFWRVGRGYVKKLEKVGIYTMGDIARCSLGGDNDFYNEALLYKMFGINAELLIDHAWGWEPCTIADVKAYQPSTNSISTGQVLQCPYSWEKTRLIVKEMTDLLVLDLVDKGLVTDQIVLTVGYDISNLTDPKKRKDYHGEIVTDHYGRQIPKHAHGTANIKCQTSSTKLIMEAVMELYDRIVNKNLLARRITIAANRAVREEMVVQKQQEAYEQLDLFTNYKEVQQQQQLENEELQKEKNIQKAVIDLKKKYGKNAVLKGMNLEEGATTIERNKQIGGHKA